jgi:hypothetical protein
MSGITVSREVITLQRRAFLHSSRWSTWAKCQAPVLLLVPGASVVIAKNAKYATDHLSSTHVEHIPHIVMYVSVAANRGEMWHKYSLRIFFIFIIFFIFLFFYFLVFFNTKYKEGNGWAERTVVHTCFCTLWSCCRLNISYIFQCTRCIYYCSVLQGVKKRKTTADSTTCASSSEHAFDPKTIILILRTLIYIKKENDFRIPCNILRWLVV